MAKLLGEAWPAVLASPRSLDSFAPFAPFTWLLEEAKNHLLSVYIEPSSSFVKGWSFKPKKPELIYIYLLDISSLSIFPSFSSLSVWLVAQKCSLALLLH